MKESLCLSVSAILWFKTNQNCFLSTHCMLLCGLAVSRERTILKLKVKWKKIEYSPLPATFTQSGIPSVKHHRYLTTTYEQPPGLFFLLIEAHGLSLHQALPLLLSQPVDMAAHVHFRDKMQTSSYPTSSCPLFSQGSKLNKKELNSLCCPLSLLCLMFTLQAACNENYQPWTAF